MGSHLWGLCWPLGSFMGILILVGVLGFCQRGSFRVQESRPLGFRVQGGLRPWDQSGIRREQSTPIGFWGIYRTINIIRNPQISIGNY